MNKANFCSSLILASYKKVVRNQRCGSIKNDYNIIASTDNRNRIIFNATINGIIGKSFFSWDKKLNSYGFEEFLVVLLECYPYQELTLAVDNTI